MHGGGRKGFSAVGAGLGHLELLDALEHPLEVRLNVGRVLGLAQDLQQVVAGDEVEAGELLALLFQIVLQTLLDLLQFFVHVGEPLEHCVVDARGGIRLRTGARLDHVL